MALQTAAKAKSITWTAVAGQSPAPPAGPITALQGYDTNDDPELTEFLKGTRRTPTRYQGKKVGYIQVEISDIAKYAALRKGQKFTNVILTIGGAVESNGIGQGSDVVITLSTACLTERGALQRANEDDAPATATIRFDLESSEADPDPTYTISAGS